MAADGVNELRLKLVHGQSHHNLLLTLPTEEAGDVLTVKHLAKEVFIATGVPIPGQRLIFKGKSLKDPSEHLSKLGMKQDSKIMLIGKKPSPFEDGILNQLLTVEKAQEKTEKKQSEITLELDGIHRNYFPKDLKGEALAKLSKRLGMCTEDYMRILERLDSISIPESHNEGRLRRKTLVAKVQKCLDRIDCLSQGINEMLSRRP